MTHELQQDVVLDSINEGVFTVDLDWRVTSFNRGAEDITGFSREEALGRPCWEVFSSTLCERKCALKRTLASGESIVNATAAIVDTEGETIPIRLSTAILRDPEGAVIGGVESFQDTSREEALRKELTSRYTFQDIIGKSAVMQKLFRLMSQVAESPSTVLIEGESGTGKELVARALHNLSPRSGGPFVAVNCAALPDTLLESELFGYKAGAFTDARQDKPGRFSLADGGTIFLDEIGDISTAMQVRLLRVLQERQIEPLGSLKPRAVNVRVVAASNKDLTALVEKGDFREDLYYRIRVVKIDIPPLRARREDVPLLIEGLVEKFNRLQGKSIAGVADDVLHRLMEYEYPGNVRELENIIEQAFVMCSGGLIQWPHLPPELREDGRGGGRLPRGGYNLKEQERLLITEVLKRFRGNRSAAAQALGIDPSTLYRKMCRYGIAAPEKDGRSSEGPG